MDKYGLTFWFMLAVVLSAIPLLKEYSKVQKSYQYVKRPHHRHNKMPLFGDYEPQLTKKKKNHKTNRDKAILESNKDYEDEEVILVGYTTTVEPVIMKRARHKPVAKSRVPECQMRIAETLPATVFSDSDLADNHLPMHDVRPFSDFF